MKRLVVGGAATVLAALVATGINFGSAQSAPGWNTFHGDPIRDGQSNVKGPTTKMVVGAWTLPSTLATSPVVDGQGNAYIGADNGVVYALNTAKPGVVGLGNPGSIRWSFTTGGAIDSVPTLSNDGSKLFVGSNDGSVYALNTSNGSKLWSVDMAGPVVGSPLPSLDGSVIYVCNTTGTVKSLSQSDGSQKWKFDTNNVIRGSLTLSPDGGTLYASLPNAGAIDGFSTSGPTSSSNNSPSVIFNSTGPPAGTPSVDSNGNVYVTTQYGTVESFAAGGGAARWVFTIPNHKASSTTPAISGGNVYFGAGDGNIYAIGQSNGQQVWQLHTVAPVESSPAVATGNGLVYIGSDDGNVYGLNGSGGTAAWIRLIGSAVTASPALSADGSMWIASRGGGVFRFLDLGAPPVPATSTPGPSPTATLTPTTGPTATPGAPTATPTTVPPTATPTSVPPALTVSANPSIAAGKLQHITVNAAANTVVHLRIDYPNGDHQSHSVTVGGNGSVVYSYKQAASKITHTNRTAKVTAKAGSSGTATSATTTYSIGYARVDVSAEPRKVARGKSVSIYVHAKKGSAVRAVLQVPGSATKTFSGKTGPKGFAHFTYKVPTSVKHGAKVAVSASLAGGGSATSTNFTVQ